MDFQDFGQQNPYDYGSSLVERVTAQEYNLAQQREDYRNAADAIQKLIGFFFSRRS